MSVVEPQPSVVFTREELCAEITHSYTAMIAALARGDRTAARTAEEFMNWFLDQLPRTSPPTPNPRPGSEIAE